MSQSRLPTRAAPSPAPPPQVSAAQTLERGIDAFEAQRFKDARAAFEAVAADPIAQYYLGVLQWQGRGGFKCDPRAAAQRFRAGADAGFAPAQVNLGVAIQAGYAEPHGAETPAQLFEAAGRSGLADGLYHLGECHRLGRGAEQDDERARALHERAAQLGHGPSMHAYGAALADGRGGPSDFVDGLAWLYAAGAAGADDAAVKAARFLAARLTARDIRRAHRKGKAIARRVKRQHPPRFDGRPALDAFLPAPASGVDKPGRH